MIISKFEITPKEKLILDKISLLDAELLEEIEKTIKAAENKRNSNNIILDLSKEEVIEAIRDQEQIQKEKTTEEILKENAIDEYYSIQEKRNKTELFTLFINGIDEDNLNNISAWENFKLNDLIQIKELIYLNIAERYLKEINYSIHLLKEDFNKTLEAYTLTDLIKDYHKSKKVNSMLYSNVVNNQEELLLYLCLEDLTLIYFKAIFLISNKYYSKLEENSKNVIYFSNVYNSVVLYDEDKKTFFPLKIEEPHYNNDLIVEAYREIVKCDLARYFSEQLDYRFNFLYHKYKLKRAKEQQYRNSHKKKKVQEVDYNQITIEDISSNIIKPNEDVKMLSSNVAEKLSTITTKHKVKSESTKLTLIYKNDNITLAIRTPNNPKYGNNPLSYTNNSYAYFLYWVTNLSIKHNISQIKENENFSPRLYFNINDLMTIFGKENNKKDSVSNFRKEFFRNAEMWSDASIERIEGRDNFSISRIISAYGSKGKNIVYIDFPNQTARELIEQSQIVRIPLSFFQLEQLELQIGYYLYKQAQMFKNHDNPKAPIFITNQKTIQIKRSINKILDNATAIDYKKVLQEDHSHFNKRVVDRLETAFLNLQEIPKNSSTPPLISWSYEGNPEKNINDFSSPEEWLESNIVFELPMPESFEDDYRKYLKNKSDSQKRLKAYNQNKKKGN